MATYRCRSCVGLYVDPQNGVQFFHTCPPQVRNHLGELVDTPNPRDENIEQLLVVGKLADGPTPAPAVLVATKVRRHGAGRVRLSEDDLLTGADAAAIAALQAVPGVPVPDL